MRDYLKTLRAEKGLSQQVIADKTGMAPSTYAMIELGGRQADMSLSVMKKLSDAFGVSLEFIIAEEMKLKMQE